MTDYAQAVAEDQRLLILQALIAAPDYSAHEHLLRQGLATLGHRISADQMRSHLAWLDEQGLINLMGDQVQVARITLRGEDVMVGAARCPGVARPRP
jgi:Fe2+ or Zn2+ uptake regulation protein